MIIKEALNKAKKELREVQVAEPESSAEFLLREVLGFNRTKLFANIEQDISSKNQKIFEGYIKRRKNHEPVWQIVGKVEFYGRPFLVNKNVLVPRPETELLIQEVLKQITNNKLQITNKFQNSNSKFEILDVGTGSGTIAVTLAAELKKRNIKHRIIATDISKDALKVARKNAKELKVEKSIKFIKSDLFERLTNHRSLNPNHFDIITANLPYIPTEDLGGLALDIHHFEPRIALEGGNGGLVIYEKFLKELPGHLAEKGTVFCEIGKGQGKDFCALVKKYLLTPSFAAAQAGAARKIVGCEILRDLAGIDRIAIIKN